MKKKKNDPQLGNNRESLCFLSRTEMELGPVIEFRVAEK